MNETIAKQIEFVLRTKGNSPSAKVYIKHNYGSMATQINQLFGEHILNAVQLIITCNRADVVRVSIVMGMTKNVTLISTTEYEESCILLYGSTQT